MYENRKQPLLGTAKFLKRVARHWLAGFGVLAFGLGGGILGYHYIARLSWIDSLLNASMILGGMGPVDPLRTNGAKIFRRVTRCFQGWRLSASCRYCLHHLFIACYIAFMQRGVKNENS
jgi:hypothetical protein